MEKHMTFGECLSLVLNAVMLKSSKLARAINVDSSLVYKWLRNERVPSYNTAYIDLIINYVSKSISDSYQRKALTEIATNYGIQMNDTSVESLVDAISLMLHESQGFSIELHNRNKIKKNHVLFNNTKCNPPKVQVAPAVSELYGEHENIQIIKGNVEVLQAAIQLLKQARNMPFNADDTILITINSGIIPGCAELYQELKQIVFDILNDGRKVIVNIKLDGNPDRTMKIVEQLHIILARNNLKVFYYKQSNDIAVGNELYIVPRIGTLFCFSSRLRNQVDRAFLFQAKDSIDALTEHFFQSLHSTKPLFKTFPSQLTVEFQEALVEAEEAPGDTFNIKGNLSSITIPLALYERYLSQGTKPNQETSYRLFLHKRRIDSFETQIKHYKYKDICFMEAVERLIDERKYSLNSYGIHKNDISSDDIIRHLEHVVFLLTKYENYELAIVSEKYFGNMTSVCCMVKGEGSVIIKAFNQSGTEASETNLSASEPSIVAAYRDLFLNIWDNIPEKNKKRENSIRWLNTQINKIKSISSRHE